MDVTDNNNLKSFTMLLFFALVAQLVFIHGLVDGSISSPKHLEIKKYLKSINKPATMTIKSPTGELIDCVDIYKQPAFDHPLLRNHTIQMKPSFDNNSEDEGSSVSKIAQDWHANGKCPKGTIPIQRIQKKDLLRAASLKNYGKKYFPQPQGNYLTINGHEHSVVAQQGGPYYGAKADINVWNPTVKTNDFSLSQIWIISDDSIQNTLEAGIMVFPTLYGDNKTRFFIYWTADGYRSTGCYDLTCPGFVQTNNHITINFEVRPLSTYGGAQYQITVQILKDPITGNWWLSVQGIQVGYWPSSLVPELSNGARLIEWGGEVYNYNFQQGSTTTQMGSGHFAREGFGKAANMQNIKTADSEGNFQNPTALGEIIENPKCYDLIIAGSGFYFGGPGKSANCP